MFLKTTDLLSRYNIERTTLHRWRNTLNFPAPITPSNTYPQWRLVDVEAWEITNKISNGDSLTDSYIA